MAMDSEVIDLRRRAVIGAAGALAAGALGAIAACAGTGTNGRVIDIVARKFEFLPDEIRVKKGEAITLRLSAPEVAMGFNLADFKQRADIVPGRVAMLSLRPDKAGRFFFLCDMFCGSGHEDMSGVLIVE